MKKILGIIISLIILTRAGVNFVNASSDDISLTTNRTSPTTSQFINLTIETDDDYIGKLKFSAKYRSSSSSSRTSISNLTSSTYFSNYSDDWDNGYYKMKSSDDGEKTLKNLVKFKKKGYYRIYVKDTDGNENYIQFNVGSSNDDEYIEDINGFSTSENKRLKEVYKDWNNMINQMKRLYPSLKKDVYWNKMSNSLYEDLEDIMDDKSNRNLDDYDDFNKAFDEWYKYTTTNI